MSYFILKYPYSPQVEDSGILQSTKCGILQGTKVDVEFFRGMPIIAMVLQG